MCKTKKTSLLSSVLKIADLKKTPTRHLPEVRMFIKNLTCNNSRFPRQISGSFTCWFLKQRLHQDDIKSCDERNGNDEIDHDCDRMQESAGGFYVLRPDQNLINQSGVLLHHPIWALNETGLHVLKWTIDRSRPKLLIYLNILSCFMNEYGAEVESLKNGLRWFVHNRSVKGTSHLQNAGLSGAQHIS